MAFEHTAFMIANALPLPRPSGMPSYDHDEEWPLPDVEIEEAEAAGLVVCPESPAVTP